MQNAFSKMLGIEFPVIMAPMFLVSTAEMVIAALENGITAAIPALNYRTDHELRQAILEIRKKSDKAFGINLIVNKSNYKYPAALKTCIELKVDFIITSLGNPKDAINQCKAAGIKVFCDVVDLTYALKVEALGADAVVAVNSRAGGHAGALSPEEFIPLLKKNLKIPVISAGGIATGGQIKKGLELGADGFSIGTLFIASDEAPVSKEYKEALIHYSAKDIVLTTKLSGTALTVINTPAVKAMGTRAGFPERMMFRFKGLRKYLKLLIAIRGLRLLRASATANSYQTVWCAGPSIEHIHSIRPLKEIIQTLRKEYEEAVLVS